MKKGFVNALNTYDNSFKSGVQFSPKVGKVDDMESVSLFQTDLSDYHLLRRRIGSKIQIQEEVSIDK